MCPVIHNAVWSTTRKGKLSVAQTTGVKDGKHEHESARRPPSPCPRAPCVMSPGGRSCHGLVHMPGVTLRAGMLPPGGARGDARSECK